MSIALQNDPQCIRLIGGAHHGPDYGMCLMEYISITAEERFSDRPRCVDRKLAAQTKAVNDATHGG